MEHFGCKILRFQRRTFMNKQVPEGNIGIANIRLENMRSIEIIKIAAGRMLLKKSTILMAGTVEWVILFAERYAFPEPHFR